MNFKVLTESKGKAKEYSELSLNIYTTCPHGCVYCYCPAVLRTDKERFFSEPKSKKDLISRLKKDLELIKNQQRHIHLCFVGDPFPKGYDHTLTREVIGLIHCSGNYVQILTKGELDEADSDCLQENDIVGVTISGDNGISQGTEPNTLIPTDRLFQLKLIKEWQKCKTFVSCEPIFEPEMIYELIKSHNYIDEYKIGKLNYYKGEYAPNINWGEFGRECERLCKLHNRKYYIKESLRAEMDKEGSK